MIGFALAVGVLVGIVGLSLLCGGFVYTAAVLREWWKGQR